MFILLLFSAFFGLSVQYFWLWSVLFKSVLHACFTVGPGLSVTSSYSSRSWDFQQPVSLWSTGPRLQWSVVVCSSKCGVPALLFLLVKFHDTITWGRFYLNQQRLQYMHVCADTHTHTHTNRNTLIGYGSRPHRGWAWRVRKTWVPVTRHIAEGGSWGGGAGAPVLCRKYGLHFL